MSATVALLFTFGSAIGGYLLARRFVARRLRFVDAIHSRWAPWIAGALAAIVASPLALLPLAGSTAALAFGLGVGLGTASGARVVRRAELSQPRLTP